MTCASCERPGGLELTERMLAAAGLPHAAHVLDVGCGAGATVAHLVDECGLRATGLDASEETLRQDREARPDLDFVAGRAEALPFADGSFDGVLCECVLSMVEHSGAVLAEMVRVLRPDGVLMLSDLYVREGGMTPADDGVAALGGRELTETRLAAAGLAVEAWEDQTVMLGRYIWDLAGTGAPLPPPRRRGASPGSGRRLGYFICVARSDGRAGKGAS